MATQLSLQGDLLQARTAWDLLLAEAQTESQRGTIRNNLAVLDAALQNQSGAELQLESLTQSGDHRAAVQHNLAQLREITRRASGNGDHNRRPRIAVLSFLFNWPSTGGGIVHTVELVQFLSKAGFEVALIHPVFSHWRLGGVDSTCPIATTPIEFSDAGWTIENVQRKFREAVDAVSPEHVIITDCWNFKPHLAAAMQGYSYLLRMQALECLCPLNNLRLQPGPSGAFLQCAQSQPKDPGQCAKCLRENDWTSGALHRAEREFSGVGSQTYNELLLSTTRQARAVLVLNESAKALWEPYCGDVRVVTWGMDSTRFPKANVPEVADTDSSPSIRILFAGLPSEPIKGFAVVHKACRALWEHRQDFELWVTADQHSGGHDDPFLRWIGWQSQSQLPGWYRRADFVVVPTLAQDGLSRTAVEGMASGKAILGSRLGSLPDVVIEGVTGLLAAPGDAADWNRQLDWLLDHPQERLAMGRAGREQFERRFTWERVIEEQYLPLLKTVV
ncbi:MAG: glycosyltransferase family 4 protein [Planctomycetaceae bacterium]|nr:glycosyltransferase family 4 protein [Planctomycetaceae bacterium]